MNDKRSHMQCIASCGQNGFVRVLLLIVAIVGALTVELMGQEKLPKSNDSSLAQDPQDARVSIMSKDGWGSDVLGFRVGVTTDKASYRTGELVFATICISNITTKTLQFGTIGEWPWGYDFIVRDGHGQRVAHTAKTNEWLKNWEGLRAGSGHGYEVQPTAKITERACISELYDLSIPGEYDIIAEQQMKADGTRSVHSGVVHIRIVSQETP